MKGAAWALSWEIVARFRCVYAWGAAYFAVACVVVAVLPEVWLSPELGWLLAVPMLLVAMAVFGALDGGGGDVRLSRSAYPRRLFTLPVSSFTLATVPFVVTMVLLASLWFAVVPGLLRPCGVNVPLVLPALAVTSAVAWMQAFLWTPLPVYWLRMFLFVDGFYGLLVGPLILANQGVDQGLLSGILGVVLVACYGTSLVGVSLARRGVGVVDRVQAERGEPSEGGGLKIPFSSPLRTQLWLEARSLGWVSLLQFSILVVFMIPLLQLAHVAWSRPFMLAAVGPMAERMGPAWMSLQLLLLLPAGFLFIGGDVCRHSAPGKHGLSGFYATRAISNTQIIQARLLTLTGFVVGLWAQLVIVGVGWAAANGHLGDMMQRLGDLADVPGYGVAVFAVGIVTVCVVNWLVILGNLWVGLTGRPWLMFLVLVAGMAVGVGTVFVIKAWQPSWLPWLMGLVVVGLAGKGGATAWVCRKLVTRGYVSGVTLVKLIVTWVVVVGMVAAVITRVTGGGWVTFAGVVLLLPLATSLLAPLALAWDRHR